jgi:hypothetical protein
MRRGIRSTPVTRPVGRRLGNAIATQPDPVQRSSALRVQGSMSRLIERGVDQPSLSGRGIKTRRRAHRPSPAVCTRVADDRRPEIRTARCTLVQSAMQSKAALDQPSPEHTLGSRA